MRILVTGGAGFVGTNLVNRLVDDKHEVIIFDNLSTGNLSNIKDFMNNENFESINHDIINTIPHCNVDIIYNLACPASPIHYQMDPIKTMKTSVLGNYNIIE